MSISINPLGATSGIGTDPLNSQTISDLFGAIDQAPTDFAASTADSALAAGDTTEGNLYGTAEGIANSNATLAQAAGQVEQAQQGLQIRQTIGSQRAAVAAGGFQEAGSAVDLLRSSTQQGLLAQQITGVNSQLQASSYLQQGTALAAQGTAAAAAGTAANDNAASLSALGTAAKTNAVNEAAALNVNIPGLANLSGTSIPTVNPVTIGNQSVSPVAGMGPNNTLSTPPGML
jgi:hypothetical protein